MAGRIVVARHDKDLNAGLSEQAHTVDKIDSCVIVLPVSVKEITGQKHKSCLFVYGKVHKIIKGPSHRTPDLFHRGIPVHFQPFERTVKVDISGMQKPEHVVQNVKIIRSEAELS